MCNILSKGFMVALLKIVGLVLMPSSVCFLSGLSLYILRTWIRQYVHEDMDRVYLMVGFLDADSFMLVDDYFY